MIEPNQVAQYLIAKLSLPYAVDSLQNRAFEYVPSVAENVAGEFGVKEWACILIKNNGLNAFLTPLQSITLHGDMSTDKGVFLMYFDGYIYDINGMYYGIDVVEYFRNIVLPYNEGIRIDSTMLTGNCRFWAKLPNDITKKIFYRKQLKTTLYRVPGYDYFVLLDGFHDIPWQERIIFGDDALFSGEGFAPEFDKYIITKGTAKIPY